ncbi:MarR family transcriptional regulator [Solwaraspora sp. WMMD1047]|uniref:GbsR/MarR family transcriptional regulator n=1 Tax=Solwaraspora sp. WMMD1047 TaxID=3016102 RepID=UPI002415B8A3|nr:MarR family transcriptional regulator [Solwaraspora sp. WMMD1047]MDG4830236.1 MarR family transcriptional regulator [Solwaraspora sp. WMMD1047]
MSDGPDQAEEVLLRYVERLALVFAQSGIPRMPARVFAYVLAEDAERYTAAELASGLRVSQAAISGAVRYLLQTGMLAKEREPGSRSDHYRIYDEDIWGAIFLKRADALIAYEEVSAEGARVLPPGSPGALRMRQNQEFFAFIRAELPLLLQRWHEHRRTLTAGEPPGG